MIGTPAPMLFCVCLTETTKRLTELCVRMPDVDPHALLLVALRFQHACVAEQRLAWHGRRRRRGSDADLHGVVWDQTVMKLRKNRVGSSTCFLSNLLAGLMPTWLETNDTCCVSWLAWRLPAQLAVGVAKCN